MMFVNTGRELRVIATLAALSISGQRKEGWKREEKRGEGETVARK